MCGYLGQTKFLSIEKNGYQFLRSLPPAPGALPINNHTQHVRACHLCILLLEKQKELNHTSNNFFFKGFFRAIGSCHTNINLGIKTVLNSPEEPERRSSKEIRPLSASPSPTPQLPIITESDQSQSRTLPPPLRKTTPSTFSFNSSDLHITSELSSLDSFLKSIRSRFLSDYTSLLSSSKLSSYDSCQFCSSIKPHGTLYSISKTQYEFLSSSQINVCTLCYYNLLDQYKNQQKSYRRPRPQCYLCHNRLNFIDWEIKFLDSEYLPFLLNQSNHEQLYDNQRLALTCDQCFYTILFQYIDQQRNNIPQDKRTYTWQCTYSYENEQYFQQINDLF